MAFFVGTSGYSYKEWKGPFYPEDLPAKEMLRHYAGRLTAVEINNTFYRLPKASVLETWASQVPPGFRFVLKASRRITHGRRLKDASEETGYLIDTARTLGERLGPILFQLPPNLRKDADRLAAFLDLLPDDVRAAFEFRHDSWHDDEVLGLLRDRDRALCLADTDEKPASMVATASWGYLRLRRPSYGDDDLGRWLADVRAQDWRDAYVFFKHEDAGAGPRMAARLMDLAADG